MCGMYVGEWTVGRSIYREWGQSFSRDVATTGFVYFGLRGTMRPSCKVHAVYDNTVKQTALNINDSPIRGGYISY